MGEGGGSLGFRLWTMSLSIWLIEGVMVVIKGAGGVPWGQIMENEFENLVDRGVHGGHLGEKFLKKYCS